MTKKEDNNPETISVDRTNADDVIQVAFPNITPNRSNFTEQNGESSNIGLEILSIQEEIDASKTEDSKFWENPVGYLKSLWNHPAGPLTIFFWAPLIKWCLVIAGLSDLQRPAANLSILQTLALAATGIIWCRYSMVITPKNYSLFSVNFFIALTQCYQLYRSIRYQYFS